MSQSHIGSALLKNGRSNFSLEIIEYCDKEKCLERERYYLKKLKPEYNIAQDTTAPMLGRNHSDETIRKISDSIKGTKRSDETKKIMSRIFKEYYKNNPKNQVTEETRKKMSDAKIGKDNAMFGKNHSDETRNKILSSQPNSIKLEVFDKENNKTTTYVSIRAASKALNLPNFNIIINYIKNNQVKPYKGRYIFAYKKKEN
jgi:group I intron endonuclease